MNSLLPFTTDIIRAFGWTLLHSFWQAFFVYTCLRIVLRIWPMASAAIKYHLSFLSLAGIAGWFLVTFYNQLNAIKEAQKIQEMAMTWDPATIAAAMEQLPQQSNGLQMMLPGMESYFPFLVAFYIIGVTLMTIKLCLDLAQLRQMRQEGISAMGVTWDEHLLKLAASMGVTRKVQLFISQHLQVPVMIGFLKPVILLPAAMVSNLSPEQLETILLHELAHIKRNDYLLNIFQSIVETILFFNPFVWWISKNIRLEREHCCDDLVIAGTVQPLHYAKALVALEEYRLTANPMAMAAADDKHHLLHRIKRIMEMKTKNLNYSQRLLALLIIVVGLVSIAWLNPGNKNKTEKKEKKSSITEMVADTIPVPPPAPAPQPAARPAAAPAAPPAVTPPSPVPATATPAPAPAPSPAFTPMAPMAPIAPPPPIAPPAPLSYYAALLPMTPPTPVNVYYAPNNVFYADIDTTTPRSRKIIVKGEDGVEKEYNSIAEMPEADRKRMEENYIRMQQHYQRTNAHFNYNFNKDYKFNKAEFEKAMKAAEDAVKKTDWSKMGKEIEASMKKINWDKMNKDMQESLKKMNWDNKLNEIQLNKLKDEIKLKFNEADWEKVNKKLQESLKKVDWDKINKQMKESMEKFRYFDSSRDHHYFRNEDRSGEEVYERNEERRARREVAMARDEVNRVRAEQRAQASRILAEQKAENSRIQAEHRAQASRIQAEQRAENNRIQAEQRRVAGDIRRAEGERRTREAEARRKALDEMLDGMQKDNLLDREKDFEIEKKGDELFINGKKQPDEVNKKYEQYLKNKNVTIKKSKDNFHMNTQDNR